MLKTAAEAYYLGKASPHNRPVVCITGWLCGQLFDPVVVVVVIESKVAVIVRVVLEEMVAGTVAVVVAVAVVVVQQ